MTRPSRPSVGRLSQIGLVMFCTSSLYLAMLAGCGDRLSSHGHIINENELKKINIGTTTKVDILEVLGKPSFAGAFENKKLYYSSQVMIQSAASLKQTQQRIIYIFSLDNKDVLISIDLINKDDGIQIAHIDEKTPTPGDTYGVIEQIFSNLKRKQPTE